MRLHAKKMTDGLLCGLFLITLLTKPGLASNEDQSELLPSDVPITMMETITSAQGQVTEEIFQLTTNLGTIDGLKEPTNPPHHKNTHMHAFRGIPFANAPVGNLRFSDPVDKVGRWTAKHLNATKYQPFCPQYDSETKTVRGNEDCLYLNVFTPAHLGDKDRASKQLLPVFVFIHGGGYIRGSSSSHGASKLLSRDIVVVTLNYRLGALGFLSTGDSVFAGNYGLLDQVSALRWVQRNIAQFGGDPKQVTIGGFSAGSASVHHHMMSPLSEGLFHRGIMMSGAGSCHWSVRWDPLNPTRQLAEKLGCLFEMSEELAKCLATKTTNQIVTAQAAIYRYEFCCAWFAPVVDGGLRQFPFLPASPENLVLRPTPTILGSVPDEGLLFAAGVILFSKHPTNVTDVYEKATRSIFQPWRYTETTDVMEDMAEAFYFSENARTSPATYIKQVTEAITDVHFVSCLWNAASTIARAGAPVYTYLMTHRDPETPVWGSLLYDKLRTLGYQSSILDEGISHGDDLIHIFKFPYVSSMGTERDHKVAQIMIQTFTNFIIEGTPKTDVDDSTLGNIPTWEAIRPDEPVGYYDISVNPTMVYTPFKEKEQHFWNRIVPTPSSSHTQKKDSFFVKQTRSKRSLVKGATQATSGSCLL